MSLQYKGYLEGRQAIAARKFVQWVQPFWTVSETQLLVTDAIMAWVLPMSCAQGIYLHLSLLLTIIDFFCGPIGFDYEIPLKTSNTSSSWYVACALLISWHLFNAFTALCGDDWIAWRNEALRYAATQMPDDVIDYVQNSLETVAAHLTVY